MSASGLIQETSMQNGTLNLSASALAEVSLRLKTCRISAPVCFKRKPICVATLPAPIRTIFIYVNFWLLKKNQQIKSDVYFPLFTPKTKIIPATISNTGHTYSEMSFVQWIISCSRKSIPTTIKTIPIDLFLWKKENTHIEFNTLSVIYQKPSSKFIKPFEHFNIQRFFLKHIFIYIYLWVINISNNIYMLCNIDNVIWNI